MFSADACLGSSCGINKLRSVNDALNARVVDEINGSQELLMLTSFARESNEYQFKKSLQDRISDVASWRWVLEDLLKRLVEAIGSLRYEQNALHTVVQRIRDELNCHSREASRPGAMCPLTDKVEKAIVEEFEYLRSQENNFQKLIIELDKQTCSIEKTKKKIENDILNKSQSLFIDETCANKDYKNEVVQTKKKKRKKGFPVARWLKRCAALKRAGLNALCNAVITRHQVRQARVQLSIAAQAYASKVDAVLRRRLCSNKIKLQDLIWQREEAIRDYTLLEEELVSAEKTLIATMDHEHIVEGRLNERTKRPNQELIKDDVNRKLRDEQTQLKKNGKVLRNNLERIINLQNELCKAIAHIDGCAEDLVQVINLDEQRVKGRQGEQSDTSAIPSLPTISTLKDHSHVQENRLSVIQEEDEEYPLNY
ncbi:tektin-3-like [Vanessa atalanta]|uniref:tektin-3-like n=1 Tax=Vanessa atalanta TaxID=42275 RepID=UPI001FCDEC4A|nr:tektin-3-like [Vanessa atalanta]